jgi:Domain of unknown function (DUF6265)
MPRLKNEFTFVFDVLIGEYRLLLEESMKLTASSHWFALVCGAIFIFAGLAFPARAQQPAGAGAQAATGPPVTSPQSPVSAPKAKLADLAWLEGRWRGDWGPRIAEQAWLAPKADVMTGVFRLVENDKTLVIEIFTLVEKPDGIDFYLRHFTPELVPWEKSDATLLKLLTLDPKKIDFENPLDGLPKHAILLRLDADTYTFRSEIVPDKGDQQVTEITYHRQKPAPEKPNAGNASRR